MHGRRGATASVLPGVIGLDPAIIDQGHGRRRALSFSKALRFGAFSVGRSSHPGPAGTWRNVMLTKSVRGSWARKLDQQVEPGSRIITDPQARDDLPGPDRR